MTAQPDLKVLCLTRYGYAGASSRDRFYHYLPYVNDEGIYFEIEPLLPDRYVTNLYAGKKASLAELSGYYLKRLRVLLRSRRYDLLYVEKELWMMAPAWGEWLLARLGIQYAVDYDDAVMHNYDLHPKQIVRTLLGNKIPSVMKNAALVIAGNEYIANIARRAGARRVERLPTSIDTIAYPYAPHQRNQRFTIGWVGSPATSKHLRHIAPALSEMTRKHGARLIIFGAADGFSMEGVNLEVPTWSEKAEPHLIRSFDVGIGPVVDAPFERGKCGFKLIKYMACGRAVVASSVGMNREIVDHGVSGFLANSSDQWVDALHKLMEDPALCARMGEAGRRLAEQRYSLAVNAPKLAAMLRRVARAG